MGSTFKVAPPLVYRDYQGFTWDELKVEFGVDDATLAGLGQPPYDENGGAQWIVWRQMLGEAAEFGGIGIDLLNPRRLYYTFFFGVNAAGGMVGAENWDTPGLEEPGGDPWVLPGRCNISGGFAYTAVSIDPESVGFSAQPSTANTLSHAVGALMHELGHAFGDGFYAPLPHTDASPWLPNIMSYQWYQWPNVNFSVSQKATLKGSPFLAYKSITTVGGGRDDFVAAQP